MIKYVLLFSILIMEVSASGKPLSIDEDSSGGLTIRNPHMSASLCLCPETFPGANIDDVFRDQNLDPPAGEDSDVESCSGSGIATPESISSSVGGVVNLDDLMGAIAAPFVHDHAQAAAQFSGMATPVPESQLAAAYLPLPMAVPGARAVPVRASHRALLPLPMAASALAMTGGKRSRDQQASEQSGAQKQGLVADKIPDQFKNKRCSMELPDSASQLAADCLPLAMAASSSSSAAAQASVRPSLAELDEDDDF